MEWWMDKLFLLLEMSILGHFFAQDHERNTRSEKSDANNLIKIFNHFRYFSFSI